MGRGGGDGREGEAFRISGGFLGLGGEGVAGEEPKN